MLKPKLIEDIKPFGKSIVALHPDANTASCATVKIHVLYFEPFKSQFIILAVIFIEK